MERQVAIRRIEWNKTWSLAIVFGLASVPWTYAFVAELHMPLWPSFIASGTFYAVGSRGTDGLTKGTASNLAGIVYAVATLAIVETVFGGGVLALSLLVGGFMLLASLHGFVPLLSFTPGGFFGYATLFGVYAAGTTAFGVAGLAGTMLATVVSMVTGAAIGLATDELSSALVPP